MQREFAENEAPAPRLTKEEAAVFSLRCQKAALTYLKKRGLLHEFQLRDCMEELERKA